MISPQNHTPEQLFAAFAEFEQASERLSSFYRSLEDQVRNLTQELVRSRAEQAHELLEKQRLASRLENLLEALPGGVVVVDGTGRVQEFNPAAVELLGAVSAGDLWADIVERAFAPRWDDGHDISLSDGRIVNIATAALTGEPGQILLLKEVSETRRLQEQLTHHKRISAKTEMAAAMAHQVRTPLASAMLTVANLRGDGLAAGEREKVVERSLRSLRKLERLVEDMLMFARGAKIEVSHIGSRELMRTVAAAVAEAFGSETFDVDVDDSGAVGNVYANVEAITSISLNLIDNSYQSTAGSGRMTIGSVCRDGHLTLVFADDGPGVPPTARDKIFEPFYSTRGNGTGLGLPVARAIARAHGGDLCLEAGAGHGARFLMSLPLADEATSGVASSAVVCGVAAANTKPHANAGAPG